MVSTREASASPTMIACGCAKSPHTLTWSSALNTIAFASANNVCLLRPESASSPPAIVSTTAAHSKPVTCVKFAKNRSAQSLPLGATGDLLLSCSADGTAAAWQVSSSGLKSVRPARAIHKGSATFCCAAVSVEGMSSRVVAATMGADCSIVIWRFVMDQTDESDVTQTISMGNAFALCGDFFFWKNASSMPGLLLCVGTSNSTLELFIEDSHNESFVKALTLTGHTDWVRAVSFNRPLRDSDDCLLASAGQDNIVRLWRLSEIEKSDLVPSTVADLPIDKDIRLRPKVIAISDSEKPISVTMEAVLTGHDGWVYSVVWEPTGSMRLLTASMDKCLVVWEPDADSGVWLESVRVGDVGGQAVGYFGGAFGPAGDRIVGHSYFGGLHSWICQKTDSGEEWLPRPTVGGHFAAVTDCAWDPTGTYLLSCSVDQTTRIFAPHKSPNGLGYVELARPQVHGHDLHCIASVSSNCFVSGAEEKIFRAFNAPRTFASSLGTISGVDIDKVFIDYSSWPEGAGVPSLGLSNKALGEHEMRPVVAEDAESARSGLDSRPAHLLEPPTEDHLMQNTLWPEVHKLYGHGYEVFSVAANHAASVIATACKASKTEHAAVMFWDTIEWQRQSEVEAHSLTVTQLAFSPDDGLLLSVSRDRTWALYAPQSDGIKWTKVAQSDKRTGIHTRIIWSGAWSPDSRYFATASRDKKVIFWRVDRENSAVTVTAVGAPYVGAEAVTAVDFAPSTVDSNYIVACGLDDGRMELLSWSESTGVRDLIRFDQSAAHSATIRRLRFRPGAGCWPLDASVQDGVFELASVSDDNCVKVHRISAS